MFGFGKKNTVDLITKNPGELKLVHLIIAAYAVCLEELNKSTETDARFPKLKPDTLIYLIDMRLKSLDLKLTAKQAKNLMELGMSIFLEGEYFWSMLENLKTKEKALMSLSAEKRRAEDVDQYEQTFYEIEKYFKNLCVDLSP